jgi:NAD(P)-dependent dehydrogenase (short-subunit alcohol dehydrogenase family)
MTNRFQGQHVVVTGGTGALGQGVVELLLEEGAHCWIPCFGPIPKDFTHGSHPNVHLAPDVDLTEPEQVKAFFSQPPALWASIHLAGGFAMASLANTTLDDFERMWRMNTVSCFLSCQAAAARIRESGHGGRIVNVAARPALEPTGGMLAYTTSKAGVLSITESLAKELSDDGILVNAILPAMIDTPANREAMPDADHKTWPKTAEIAGTISFLASGDNALSSGASMHVYGKLH